MRRLALALCRRRRFQDGAVDDLRRPYGTRARPARDVCPLELLHTVGRDGPLLVDDAHWLDRASAQLPGFAARRLNGSRVGVLAAARSNADGIAPSCRIATLRPDGQESVSC